MSIRERLKAINGKERQRLIDTGKESPIERLKREHSLMLKSFEMTRVPILQSINEFSSLPAATLARFSMKMERLTFNNGEVIIKQGDIGDGVYILERGLLEVTLKRNFRNEDEVPTKAGEIKENSVFGEMSITTNVPRSATITVISSDAVCLKMSQAVFNEALQLGKRTIAEARAVLSRSAVEKIPFFSEMAESQKEKMVQSLQIITFAEDSYICKQGAIGNAFFVLVQGQCRVTINTNDFHGDKMIEKLIHVLEPGSYFGEVALLELTRRTSNVIASTEAMCLTMTKFDFDLLFRGKLRTILQKQETYKYYVKPGAINGNSSLSTVVETDQMANMNSTETSAATLRNAVQARISAFDIHGNISVPRLKNFLRRFAKFTTEALWVSAYSRLWVSAYLDRGKAALHGEIICELIRNQESQVELLRNLGADVVDEIRRSQYARKDCVALVEAKAAVVFAVDPAMRTQAEHDFVHALMLQNNFLLKRTCSKWPPRQFQDLCKRTRLLACAPMTLVVEGGIKGSSALVLLRGTARLFLVHGARIEYLGEVIAGDICNEDILFGAVANAATVLSITKCDFAVVERADFEDAQENGSSAVTMDERYAFLHTLPLFRGWTQLKLYDVANGLAWRMHPKDTVLFEDGTEATLTFILSGRVDIMSGGGGGAATSVSSIQRGGYFGESGLINSRMGSDHRVAEVCRGVCGGYVEVLEFPPDLYRIFDVDTFDQVKRAFKLKCIWRRKVVADLSSSAAKALSSGSKLDRERSAAALSVDEDPRGDKPSAQVRLPLISRADESRSGKAGSLESLRASSSSASVLFASNNAASEALSLSSSSTAVPRCTWEDICANSPSIVSSFLPSRAEVAAQLKVLRANRWGPPRQLQVFGAESAEKSVESDRSTVRMRRAAGQFRDAMTRAAIAGEATTTTRGWGGGDAARRVEDASNGVGGGWRVHPSQQSQSQCQQDDLISRKLKLPLISNVKFEFGVEADG